MGAEYKLRIKNAAGVLQAEVINYLWLSYLKKNNAPGLLRFRLPNNAAIIPSLADMWQIEVWRRNLAQGVDWYQDFGALFKNYDEQQSKLGSYVAVCPGDKELLWYRVVAWAANTANRSQFTGVEHETIAKTLVTYNSTGSATTGAGRKADGTPAGYTITVETDSAGGNSLDWACTGDILGDSLYSLSLIGGGDFDLIKTGVTTWDFRYYEGQRGQDLTASAIFSTEHGNMANPSHSVSRIDERTRAVVAGQGQGADRVWRTRDGANYSGTTNKTEVLVDARNSSVNAELDAAGDARLAELQAREEFGFTLLQTPALAYGVDYCIGGVMGDLVTASYFGQAATQKIDEVTVAFEPGKPEQIEIRTRDA